MYTRPSIKDMIDSVMVSLKSDVAPELVSSRAKMCLGFAQMLLQCTIQRLEGEQQILVAEHNEMTALYRGIAECVAKSQGEAAEQIRERGRSMGGLPDIPAPCSNAALHDAHHRLSMDMLNTLDDLDVLIRAGDTNAEKALDLLRRHLFTRTERDFSNIMVTFGSLVGRD